MAQAATRSDNEAWHATLAAAHEADRLAAGTVAAAFRIDPDRGLAAVEADHPLAAFLWEPLKGWRVALSDDDPRRAMIDLYLPVCSATIARPITVGHLGQSLDGFIATHAGDSQFVTGEENIRHLHRMRALCDAVVVGAGTIAADDPQLTTRHVAGPSPVRVVFDPSRRLTDNYRVFTDSSADTLYVCARSLVKEGESRLGHAAIVAVDDLGSDENATGTSGRVDVAAVLALLRRRGCHRIFVEGGGVTVSTFLEASLLDRLQIAVAPLFIGDGRPAIRLPARPALSDCYRPRYRVFRMGTDVLFDCDLSTTTAAPDARQSAVSGITRVI